MKGDKIMMTKGINTRQLINYAKENGYDSVKFSLKRNGEHVVTGRFLDAYYEFVQFPIIGEGFVVLNDIEDQIGYDITFDVLSDEEFKTWASLDFILRGKQIPKKYLEVQDDPR